MGFDLDAKEIFLSILSTYSAVLRIFYFKRNIVQIYAQHILRAREQMFMTGAHSLCIKPLCTIATSLRKSDPLIYIPLSASCFSIRISRVVHIPIRLLC